MKMYEITATMVDSETRKEYKHKMLVPCASDEAADNAAFELGYVVNLATDHRLKIRGHEAKVVGESYLR